MAEPLPRAGALDLEALDAFLMSDRAPEDCMQLSDLDGFLTAIATGPELIKPSEWLPVIWGDGEPEFESLDEARRILGTIMLRYNEILRLLRADPGSYEPIFWQTEDGAAVASDWAEGFMDGVRLRPAAWEPLLASEETTSLIAPIVVHLSTAEGEALVEAEGSDLDRDKGARRRADRPCRRCHRQALEGSAPPTEASRQGRAQRSLSVRLWTQVQALLRGPLTKGAKAADRPAAISSKLRHRRPGSRTCR